MQQVITDNILYVVIFSFSSFVTIAITVETGMFATHLRECLDAETWCLHVCFVWWHLKTLSFTQHLCIICMRCFLRELWHHSNLRYQYYLLFSLTLFQIDDFVSNETW